MDYQSRLHTHLAEYHAQHRPGSQNRHASGADADPQALPEQARTNILPRIRERFLQWFAARDASMASRALDQPDSSQALAFNLFFPFFDEASCRVDSRLLQVMGLPTDVPYTGEFGKVLDEDENTRFDFYLEGPAEHRIFVRVELAAREFGSCADDEGQRQKLEQHYRPHLAEHVDARWLEKDNFFSQYEVLRALSYLGRHPQAGLAFIFPKANESLVEAGEVIKKMCARSLAPRVAILYLEAMVTRILAATEADAGLHEHFVQFQEKYVLERTA